MVTLVLVGWTPRLTVPVCIGLRTAVASASLALLGGQQSTDPLMMILDTMAMSELSEATTFDPVVDPAEPPQVRRRNRSSRRSRGSNSNGERDQDLPEAPVLSSDAFLAHGPAGDTVDSNVAGPVHVGKSSSASWNSKMGPEKGVKYRSGMPPQPPAWRYKREDLRSFVNWERKLSVCQLQIQSYMNRREAALLLFTSLSGEAEEELENCDLAKVNSASGIEYIQEQLRQGLQTKLVYQKRKLLADHESIVRQNNESLRAFANRYRRTERALASVGASTWTGCTTMSLGAIDFWSERGLAQKING